MNQFNEWREHALDEAFNSDVSTLRGTLYQFKDIITHDETGDQLVSSTSKYALLLPGSAIELVDPTGKKPNVIMHHPQICSPSFDLTTCKGRAKAGESLKDLIKSYPAVMVAAPYVPSFPDFSVAPILAAGYLVMGDASLEIPTPAPTPVPDQPYCIDPGCFLCETGLCCGRARANSRANPRAYSDTYSHAEPQLLHHYP